MRLAGALILAVVLWGPSARAQTCSASTAAVVFGTYAPLSGAGVSTTGSVTVTCQATVALLVSYAISLGGGASGNIQARAMSGTGGTLPYQIYTNAGHTIVWGDGTGGSQTQGTSYLLSVLVPVVNTFTAYGTIAANLRVSPGTYGDTVTVLVTY